MRFYQRVDVTCQPSCPWTGGCIIGAAAPGEPPLRSAPPAPLQAAGWEKALLEPGKSGCSCMEQSRGILKQICWCWCPCSLDGVREAQCCGPEGTWLDLSVVSHPLFWVSFSYSGHFRDVIQSLYDLVTLDLYYSLPEEAEVAVNGRFLRYLDNRLISNTEGMRNCVSVQSEERGWNGGRCPYCQSLENPDRSSWV